MKNRIFDRSFSRLARILASCTAAVMLFSPAFAQDEDASSRRSLVRAAREITDPGARISLLRFPRRGDIAPLPDDLRNRLTAIAARPHTHLPLTLFSEAEDPSLLFQYYLLDTNDFQPNIWTTQVEGINDEAIQTGANFANGGLPTIGAVRIALEPRPGLTLDPDNPGAFIDIFTDISGLFVINNESGWYEGWMIQDIIVPVTKPASADGTAQFNSVTPADAAVLAAMGTGNNETPGNVFTVDGNVARFPAAGDVFPGTGKNTVAHPVSMGAYNSLQQSDVHSYWEFNVGTNWVFPHYEIVHTGGVPGTYAAGLQYENLTTSRAIPGSGPQGILNGSSVAGRVAFGDNPDDPRDPDRTEGENGQAETRLRFVPSAVDREILYNVFLRTQSFHPDETNTGARFFLAYAAEVARIDEDGDGIISFEEAALDGTFDGGGEEELSNSELYLSPRAFNRFAVTRELNDGMLAPRFAPSERGYVLAGNAVILDEAIEASVPEDADLR